VQDAGCRVQGTLLGHRVQGTLLEHRVQGTLLGHRVQGTLLGHPHLRTRQTVEWRNRSTPSSPRDRRV
jgi:hypothetical protein